MPTRFTAFVVLKGQSKRKVTKYFDLGEFNGADGGADFLAAISALNQVAGALAAVTEATVIETGLRHTATVAAAANTGDLFNQGLVRVRIPTVENPEKGANVYIPAIKPSVMVGLVGSDFDNVDTADADLIQYVQQLAQHTFLSDGEQINTGTNNGMFDGHRVVSSYSG